MSCVQSSARCHWCLNLSTEAANISIEVKIFVVHINQNRGSTWVSNSIQNDSNCQVLLVFLCYLPMWIFKQSNLRRPDQPVYRIELMSKCSPLFKRLVIKQVESFELCIHHRYQQWWINSTFPECFDQSKQSNNCPGPFQYCERH